MKQIGFLSAALLSVVVSVSVAGTSPPNAPTPDQNVAPEARIPFANHGGIYNWQVVNNRTVLIQGQNRQWYKATLFSACIDLPFTERLGFESSADGSFDKFSSIKVRRQNCPLVSLVKTTPPAKKGKAKKLDAVAAATAMHAASAAQSSPAQ